MRRHPVLAEASVLERDTCPRMQQFIERIALKYQFNLFAAGACLLLALPESADRLIIAGLSGERIGLTHCIADAEEYLACDTDMVLLLTQTGWQPLELVHSDAVWQAYACAVNTTSGLPIQDEAADVLLVNFAEYWAQQLQAQGWLEQSFCVVGESKIG